MGWTVIRFWGKEIRKDTDKCLKAIEEAVFDLKMQEGELETNDQERYI